MNNKTAIRIQKIPYRPFFIIMRYLILNILLACVYSVFAEQVITIRGKVQFTDPGFQIIAYRTENFKKDTLGICEINADHMYELKLPVEKPGLITLNCANWQSVRIWLENENLDIDFRGKDTARVKIKNPPFVYIRGGKNNELMNCINFEAYRNYQQMIAISQATYRAKFTSDEERQSLSMKLYDANNENYKEHLRYLVRHYADRTSVMAAIDGLNYEEDSLLIRQALEKMISVNPHAVTLAESFLKQKTDDLVRKRRMAPGCVLPSFTCFDENGNSIKLSDYKGKAIVLDFWASWCGPCRQEIPHLKELYEEFKDKNIAFLSVSIDTKKQDWIKALRAEQMPWQQAWVKDSGKNVMSELQFSGIPFILVLDQEGRIYRKNLRGKQIEEALSELLQGKAVSATAQPVSMSMSAM